ncbi:helix-turn-helix domain-containing protein [Kitasatospora purpeofusca]|uniref:helix-turn-helix domain-containing protein n=1 Tax=Kitasatospora purpeofusca TaxID=67352 RepID=UPI00369DE7B0
MNPPLLTCEQCKQDFERKSNRGRSPRFCTPRCRVLANRKRAADPVPPSAPLYDMAVARLTQDLAERSKRLSNVVGRSSDPRISDLAELEHAAAVAKALEDVLSGVVLKARTRGVRWSDIAKATGVSTETARTRWDEGKGARLLQRWREQAGRRPRRSTGRRVADSRRPKASAVFAARDLQARLASALSQAQRSSGKTMRQIATESRVSASYVSRMLSGTRLPSWEVVTRFAAACDVEAEQFRILWEEARGQHDSGPFFAGRPHANSFARARLTAALQGLHMAAHRPDACFVSERTEGRLTPEQVAGIISGAQCGSWRDIAIVVTALEGKPARIKGLWECVQLAQNPRWTPENPLPAQWCGPQNHSSGLPAESF